MIRAFLAIELPDALRPGLAQVQGELKRSRADVRWVPVGNIHLTLKFFGNVPDDEIDALARAARAAAAQSAPLQLQVTVAGAFPSPNAPRVVWLGLGGDLLPLTRLYYRPGEGLRRPGLSAGRPGLQPAPHPGPGEIPGQPGAAGPAAGQAAAPKLAAVHRQGVDSVSERLVAPGVEIYAVEVIPLGEQEQ